jgi:hypothetical protein
MRSGSASRVCPANTTFHGPLFRGCSYSFMFRPPSLLASRVVPTATGSPAGQLRLLHPSRTCIVAFARIGYAIRPTTGNWRSEDLHLARFTALSTAPLTFGVQSNFPGLYKRRWGRDMTGIAIEAGKIPTPCPPAPELVLTLAWARRAWGSCVRACAHARERARGT